MNDLYDALTKAISDYMNADNLMPRKKDRVRTAHERYAYNYDVVDKLLMEDQMKDEDSE